MKPKEIIDTLRVCADGDIICTACTRYDKSPNGGTADCVDELMNEAADALEAAIREQEERENPKPLTLDELRKMDGEPVWIDDWLEDFHGWELSEDASDYFEGDSRTVESYGKRWVAYRSKPKGDS